VQTIALETLAINLLTFMTRERDHRAAVGVTSQRAVVLSRAFCADCLLGAPAEAWELPRTSIRAWLNGKNRCARRRRGSG